MGIIQSIKDFFNPEIGTPNETTPVAPQSAPPLPAAGYGQVFTISYDGEKSIGDFGPAKRYVIDHFTLRTRSWQLYLESDICQTVFKRYATWTIGSGLKLEAEPMTRILESQGINVSDTFTKSVEDRFRLFAKSHKADYFEEENLHTLSHKAFMGSIVGGDMLVVLRVDKGRLNVQIIDGENVCSPIGMPSIKNGIERDARGRIVAYHVKTSATEWTRITAKHKGLTMAYLVKGLRYRTSDHRGIPLITAVMETAKKLDRYKEATIGAAEESAKIALSVEHSAVSTGENPLLDSTATASGFGKPATGDQPIDVAGKELSNKIVATTGKQAINLPVGAKLVSHESKKELYFNDFFTANIQLVCATVGIPPEVALMKYDSNFSASRAALKDWEHTLNVNRAEFVRAFYMPIYNLWLRLEILRMDVVAPGFIAAIQQGNDLIVEAYSNARFTGANVPHIDPLKEVKAEREKLGELSKHIPLTTVEAATEALNGGDSSANIFQFAKEREEAEKAGLDEEKVNRYSSHSPRGIDDNA